MEASIITGNDVLAKVIHSNYRVLVVLGRMGIKLGLGSKTVHEIAEENNLNTEAFILILNVFCNMDYSPNVTGKIEYLPDILMYLKSSHGYFLGRKIPAIRDKINELVQLLQDSKADMVKSFFTNYIEEVTEHIEYENITVFPYIEELYSAYMNETAASKPSLNFEINVYGDEHEDIKGVLHDLKNILIRYLPQVEKGDVRRNVLQQLFELESDLFSHAKIEDEVLIPLVKDLEGQLGNSKDN